MFANTLLIDLSASRLGYAEGQSIVWDGRQLPHTVYTALRVILTKHKSLESPQFKNELVPHPVLWEVLGKYRDSITSVFGNTLLVDLSASERRGTLMAKSRLGRETDTRHHEYEVKGQFLSESTGLESPNVRNRLLPYPAFWGGLG